MANFLGTLLYFLVLLAIVFGVMFLGRKYVFSKVRINKYIPLGIAIVLFLTILTVTFFLWFMDIVTTGGPKQKEKKIEIRPKAKPNRVKHLNNAQNNTNNKK